MPAHCTPAPNLSLVILASPAHVITAVPLEPAPRIVRVNPSILPPHRKRLRRVHTEKVELRVVELMTQFRAGEPARRKLIATVGHVLAAEHAEAEHLLRSEVRREVRVESPPRWLRELVRVAALHQVVHDDL